MSELENTINQLSDAEKILLVEKIWNSIDKKNSIKLSASQEKEINRRLKLVQSRNAAFLSLEDIKARFNALK